MKLEFIEKPLNKMALKQKFLLATGAPLVLLLLLIIVFFFSIDSFVQTSNVLKNAIELQILIGDIETGQRGFLITGDDNFLRSYESARKQFSDKIEKSKDELGDDMQIQLLDSISLTINEWYIKAAEPEIESRRKINRSKEGIIYQGKDTAQIKTKIEDVIDPKMLREFQKIFTEATGIANLVVEKDGKPVKYQTFDEFSEFCFGYMRKSKEGTARCEACDVNGGKVSAETNKPYLYDCHAGLIDFGVPIILEGKLIGSWQGGQILVERPNEAKFRAYAKEVGIEDVNGFIQALRKVPFMSRDRANAAAAMLDLFAKTVSGMGNDQLVWQQLINRIKSGTGKQLLDKAKMQIDHFVTIEKERSTTQRNITFSVMIIGSIIALAVGFIIVMLVLKGIYRQLGGDPMEIAQVARKISLGYLDIVVVGNTYTGVYADMHIMVAKLRDVVQKIRESAKNFVESSQKFKGTAEQISQGASQQAASVEEVSASMEQMGANIAQNSEHSQITERIVLKSVDNILVSGKALEDTVNSMKTIAERISIIGEIASKTDMLAINASIEAAKAGLNGKGFAVVANEIRKLADLTKKAATEINLISTSSMALAEKSGKLLSEAIPDIKKTAELIQQISASTIEQNSGIVQVNMAIQQLVQVAQQNTSVSEEMTESADELSTQSMNLLETVSFFKIDEKDKEKLIIELTKQSMQFQRTIELLKGENITITPKAEKNVKNEVTSKSEGDEPNEVIINMNDVEDNAYEKF
jgi:methyl-accepting chemotaxis protein